MWNFESMKIERIDRTRGNVTRGWENNGTILRNERLILSLVFLFFKGGGEEDKNVYEKLFSFSLNDNISTRPRRGRKRTIVSRIERIDAVQIDGSSPWVAETMLRVK